MNGMTDAINPEAKPSGDGCKECLENGTWWLHLRRCAECGHIGCCDSSPNQHATKHYEETGHNMMTSFEPGESWYYNYETGQSFASGPELAPPHHRPEDQAAPAPVDKVPADWKSKLHQL